MKFRFPRLRSKPSIKLIMVAITITMALIPLISLTVMYYSDSRQLTERMLMQETRVASESIKLAVEDRLQEVDSLLKQLIAREEMKNGTPEVQSKILRDVVENQPIFELIAVLDTRGMQIARDAGANGNRADRDYFIEAMKDKNYISSSYISATTKKPTVTISMPIKSNDGKIKFILSANLKLEYIQQLIAKASPGEEGYAYMADQSGITIAHPSFDEYVTAQKNIGTTFAVKEALEGKSATSTWVNSKGDEYYGTYMPIETPYGAKWGIISQVSTDEIAAPVRAIVRKALLTLSILLAIVSVITYITTEIYVRPLRKIMEVTQKVTKGDLTETIQYRSLTREYDVANDSINQMISTLNGLIVRTQGSIRVLTDSASVLSANTSSLADGSSQIAATMQELAAGNESQADQISLSVGQAESLEQEIAGINDKTLSVFQLSKSLNAMTKESTEQVNEITRQINDSRHTLQLASQDVRSLADQSAQIQQAVKAIGEIAAQTNLLALNASIEAARAGEHGRGFAVVADEVKKLAEQSGRSAKQVGDIIEEIEGRIEKSVQGMTAGEQAVESSTRSVLEFLGVLDRIASSLNGIVEHMEDVAQSTDRMNASTGQVVEAMSQLGALSEETSAGVEQVSASVTNQLQDIEQINRYAKELRSIADELQATVVHFKAE